VRSKPAAPTFTISSAASASSNGRPSLSRQQLTLRIAAADVPQAETLLTLAGAESLTLRDAGDDPVLEPPPNETPLWPEVELRALFHAAADLRPLVSLVLSSCATASEPQVVLVEDDDWRRAARQGFTARRFGKRLWLAPADEPQVPAGLTGVMLHMGLAFGTGEHPTTALCLEWIEAHLSRDARVLDYGCGSGVLAIAALAFGARTAWAIDNDPQALAATRDNAHLNGCAADRLFVGMPSELPRSKMDVVLANILAAPLVALAGEFADRLVPGGHVVLSGVLERQVPQVAAAYEPYFSALETVVRGGWARIDGVRRPG
jgi:ribosomal protein L11 methyltransferase